jgi:hypothetical protein
MWGLLRQGLPDGTEGEWLEAAPETANRAWDGPGEH